MALGRNVLGEFLTYRVRLLIGLIDNIGNPIIVLLAILGAKSITASANPSSLISYYFGIAIFLPFLYISIEETIGEMTFTGEVGNFLVKPISFYKWMIVREFGRKLATVILVFPLTAFLVFFVFFSKMFPVSPVNIFSGIVAFGISFLLSFNFGYLLGLFSFWFDEIWVIRNVREVLVSLLGGIVLPYSFFPTQVGDVIKYLPFPYLIAWPSKVMKSGLMIEDLAIAILWLLLSFLAIRILWSFSTKQYSAIGG